MILANEGAFKSFVINGNDIFDTIVYLALLPAICQFDVPMEHVTALLPCRRPTQCSLQGVIGNYYLVALLLRGSRLSPMVVQDELIGIVGRPLHLLLLRDHIDVDWHIQEHQPPLFVDLGPVGEHHLQLVERMA